MTNELAEFLKKASEHCGSEAELREDYSGRGMCGQSTAAVVVDNPDELLLNVIQYVKELAADRPHINAEHFSELIPDVSDVGHLRTDNMGHQTILY